MVHNFIISKYFFIQLDILQVSTIERNAFLHKKNFFFYKNNFLHFLKKHKKAMNKKIFAIDNTKVAVKYYPDFSHLY